MKRGHVRLLLVSIVGHVVVEARGRMHRRGCRRHIGEAMVLMVVLPVKLLLKKLNAILAENGRVRINRYALNEAAALREP